MTAAQKANQLRFKKVQAEAKKLKAKNKKLTHIQAVKQAWAIILNKKPVSKKVGALPIGFTGTIWGIKFKVVNQFDVYNDVSAIVENIVNGSTIVVFDGNGSTKDKAEQFTNYVLRHGKTPPGVNEKDRNDLKRRLLSFCTNMQKEVKDYNSGKKKTIKKLPLKIDAPKGKLIKIKKPVTSKVKKHHSHWGKVKTHERRVSGLHKDTKSHNVNIKVMSGIGAITNNALQKIKENNQNIIKLESSILSNKETVKNKFAAQTPFWKNWYAKRNKEISEYIKTLKKENTKLKRHIK